MHLFVDPRAEEPLTAALPELTGETRSFEEVAAEAKLEQATTTFEPEVGGCTQELPDVPNLAAGARVVPRLPHVRRAGARRGRRRGPLRDRARRRSPTALARILLLEERGHDEFVTPLPADDRRR